MEAWKENPLAEKYPLVFTSERSKYKVHTQYTRVPWLLEFEDEPYVAVNPVDCEARGIADGDYIRMFNDRGTCTLRVRFNNGIRPGMVVIDHGWDLDQFVDGFYCDLLGYNVTPVVANSYYFDTLIEIEKATV
ncbi:molybdopterin dinucleotide binding domain-containing protein [Gordonibacter pamelaeae]